MFKLLLFALLLYFAFRVAVGLLRAVITDGQPGQPSAPKRHVETEHRAPGEPPAKRAPEIEDARFRDV